MTNDANTPGPASQGPRVQNTTHTTMAESIPHDPRSCFNPYAVIPAIGRVWHALYLLGAEQGARELSIRNRQIAQQAEVSPGSLPRLLRQLADDGHIDEYDPQQSLVVLCLINPLINPDQSIDQTPNLDQKIDQAPPAAERIATLNSKPLNIMSDQSVDQNGHLDQSFDQADQWIDQDAEGIATGNTQQEPILINGLIKEDRSRSRSIDLSNLDLDLERELKKHRIYPSVIRDLVAARFGSAADFAADLAIACRNPRLSKPAAYVVSYWQRGQRVTDEVPEDDSATGHAPAGGNHRGHAAAEGNPSRGRSLADLPRINLAELGIV